MSESIVLVAQKREVAGKKVQALRRDGLIPATVYEKGKESFNVQVEYNPLVKVYSAVGMGQPIMLEIGTKKYLTMVKDIHRDPAKNTIMHVAFHAVNANEPVEAEVSVHIEGEVPAEKLGNFIVRPNDTVTVSALPTDLPEYISVSADKLEQPGDHLTVADLVVPKELTILSEPDTVLATVEEPRKVEEEPAPEAAVDAADVPSAHGGESADEAKE
jgi:large subunit ribosomal protein L25